MASSVWSFPKRSVGLFLRTRTWNLKIGGWETTFVLGRETAHFQGRTASFRECTFFLGEVICLWSYNLARFLWRHFLIHAWKFLLNSIRLSPIYWHIGANYTSSRAPNLAVSEKWGVKKKSFPFVTNVRPLIGTGNFKVSSRVVLS